MKIKLNGEYSEAELLQMIEDAKKDNRPKNIDGLVDSLKKLVCYETDGISTVKKERGCICAYEQPTLELSEGLYAISILKQLAYVLNDMEDDVNGLLFVIRYDTVRKEVFSSDYNTIVSYPLCFKRREDAEFVLEHWKDTLEKAKLFV